MAGIEYLPTDLPRFVKTTSRTALSNSVVKAGHVLLFSEDGETMTAKLPDGSFVTIGGGGGGSSTDYFKCASVTSGGSTWTGYKAILSGGVYSFESTVTSGLTYGSGYTPEIGKIYTDGALVRASLFEGIPTAGLVFHAPLNTSSATAATGQTMSKTGTITFGTVQGIPCASLDGYSYLTGSASLTSGNAPFTMSLWLKSNTDQEVHVAFCMGPLGVKTAVFTGIRYSTIYGAMFCYSDEGGGVTVDTSAWIHLCYVWDGDYMKTYANGQYVRQYQFGTVDIQSGWKIGGNTWASEDWDGYIAAVRVYSRALNTSEISMLAAEFTPSV